MIFNSDADKAAFEKDPAAFAERMAEENASIPYLEDAPKTNEVSIG